MTVINAEIITMDGGIRYRNGYVASEGGKITAVGNMADFSAADGEVIDARGGVVIPGLIDAHCHLGIFGDALGFESSDGNEETDPITPHLRAIDAVNPLDRCFEDARRGGVTTVVTGPGSANVLGGQTAAIKTRGNRVDDMILKAPCSVKCAFGENPKTVYHGKDRSPVTRMATAALLREALYAAKNYGEKLSDGEALGCDLKNEALLSLLRGEIPLHAHAHRADDICTALRLAEEFGIEVKIVHGTEGHLIADALAAAKTDVMVGPSLGDRGKPELKSLTFETAGILQNAGVRVAVITDHPEVPIHYLLLCAQLAAKNGMTEDGALRAVTCDAAAIAGIDGRVGRIKRGYDADLVVFDRNPMLFDAKLLYTIIDGEKLYK
jgi:imidazolonepropionase-like amidohydrolase